MCNQWLTHAAASIPGRRPPAPHAESLSRRTTGRPLPALHAHHDQVALAFCGNPHNFTPGFAVRRHQFHGAELGGAGNRFLKTEAKRLLGLLQEVTNGQILVSDHARHMAVFSNSCDTTCRTVSWASASFAIEYLVLQQHAFLLLQVASHMF